MLIDSRYGIGCRLAMAVVKAFSVLGWRRGRQVGGSGERIRAEYLSRPVSLYTLNPGKARASRLQTRFIAGSLLTKRSVYGTLVEQLHWIYCGVTID